MSERPTRPRVTIEPFRGGARYALRGVASKELLTHPRFDSPERAADHALVRGWLVVCPHEGDPLCCGSPEECARL